MTKDNNHTRRWLTLFQQELKKFLLEENHLAHPSVHDECDRSLTVQGLRIGRCLMGYYHNATCLIEVQIRDLHKKSSMMASPIDQYAQRKDCSLDFQSVAQEDQQVLVERNQEMRKTTNDGPLNSMTNVRKGWINIIRKATNKAGASRSNQPKKARGISPSRTAALLRETDFPMKLVYRKYAKKSGLAESSLYQDRPYIHV